MRPCVINLLLSACTCRCQNVSTPRPDFASLYAPSPNNYRAIATSSDPGLLGARRPLCLSYPDCSPQTRLYPAPHPPGIGLWRSRAGRLGPDPPHALAKWRQWRDGDLLGCRRHGGLGRGPKTGSDNRRGGPIWRGGDLDCRRTTTVAFEQCIWRETPRTSGSRHQWR